MRACQSVLLLHVTPAGRHHDWLFEAPGAPGGIGPLVCFRVGPDSGAWAEARRLVFDRLADHRRRYLDYEGSLSGGRGRVRRVDVGSVVPRLWSVDRAVLEVRLGGFAGGVILRRVGRARWLGEARQEA